MCIHIYRQTYRHAYKRVLKLTRLYCYWVWVPSWKRHGESSKAIRCKHKNWNLEHEGHCELSLCLMKCLFLSDCPCWSETVLLKKKALCSILKRMYWGAVVFLVVASRGTVWQLLEGASMITVFKDIFKNQPHCWIHLVLEPCSLLFPLEFLMLPSMALWKRAPRKPPCHQQDSKTVLCCSVGVLTLSACQWLQRCICNSVELKKRSRPMIFFLFVC